MFIYRRKVKRDRGEYGRFREEKREKEEKRCKGKGRWRCWHIADDYTVVCGNVQPATPHGNNTFHSAVQRG